MVDPRLRRLAELLVHYSTEVKPGDWVGILGDALTLPALREVYTAVVRAGGHPSLMISDEQMARTLLREASDDQLTWLDPALTQYFDQGDVYIRIGGGSNTRAMTGLPSARVQQMAKAMRPWLETRMRRAAEGEMRWVGTWFPNEASAQEANMSLEEYADFVYSATFCDQENPIARWQEVQASQQQKIEYLTGKRTVTLKGPNIDLTLSIANRVFINACGTRNMPDGEIFTGPVEDSANGWVRFSYPSIVRGQAVSGIELRFEDGKVVAATAAENQTLLESQLNTDAGARYLGEFAFGTNFGIQRFTGNILFDEKIGGTIHMAVGAGYPDTGSVNRSAVHWDMICDMREDSDVYVDDELFYRNGQFTN